MRYGQVPRWTYIMLVVMGVGFMAGAGLFFFLVPAPAGQIVGAIWIVMGAGMALFSLRALAKGAEDDRIAHGGAAANATLLSAQLTNVYINNLPQWALRLRIDGYGAPYETTLKVLTFNPPSNGETFAVRVDPARRDHVVLASDDGEGSGGAAASAATTTSRGGVISPSIEASILAALKKSGLADASATTTVTRPDAAETVKLLADLDRMHASGALGDEEFQNLKRKLLGES